MLSDRHIKQEIAENRIRIHPFNEASVQPSTVDIHLAGKFRIFNTHCYCCISPQVEQPYLTTEVGVNADGNFTLGPREFVLASSQEVVTLPSDVMAQLSGCSSLGRLGLVVHQTAGVIDAGFSGSITLELSNAAPLPISLTPGMRIGQLSFTRLSSPCDRPYGSERDSKYWGQCGPTASRSYLDPS